MSSTRSKERLGRWSAPEILCQHVGWSRHPSGGFPSIRRGGEGWDHVPRAPPSIRHDMAPFDPVTGELGRARESAMNLRASLDMLKHAKWEAASRRIETQQLHPTSPQR